MEWKHLSVLPLISMVVDNLGAGSVQSCHLTSMRNPIMEIKQSNHCLISTMGFALLVKWHLYYTPQQWSCCWGWGWGLYWFHSVCLCVHPASHVNVNANYDCMALWVGAWFWNHDLWISETPFATHSGGQCANDSAMTHPSKMDW